MKKEVYIFEEYDKRIIVAYTSKNIYYFIFDGDDRHLTVRHELPRVDISFP